MIQSSQVSSFEGLLCHTHTLHTLALDSWMAASCTQDQGPRTAHEPALLPSGPIILLLPAHALVPSHGDTGGLPGHSAFAPLYPPPPFVQPRSLFPELLWPHAPTLLGDLSTCKPPLNVSSSRKPVLTPKELRPSRWGSNTAPPFTMRFCYEILMFHSLCPYFFSCEMGNTVPVLCLFCEQMSYHV